MVLKAGGKGRFPSPLAQSPVGYVRAHGREGRQTTDGPYAVSKRARQGLHRKAVLPVTGVSSVIFARVRQMRHDLQKGPLSCDSLSTWVMVASLRSCWGDGTVPRRC